MGRKKFTTEKFIELSQKVHGDKYDYSLVNYVDMHTKVKIKCPTHGVFEIYPDNHSNKKAGCEQCGIEKAAISRQIGFNAFKKRAAKVHNNKYEYIEKSYKGTLCRLDIICPLHGKFSQFAHNHLYAGAECGKCSILGRRKKHNNS